jgi:hypothetical protein
VAPASLSRRSVARRALAAVALATFAVPALAWACPYCARDLSPGIFALLGVMILSPFAVVAIVVRVIRKVDSGRDA